MIDYRLECLRLAHQPELPASEVVARANAYHDFLLGKSDQTPRQVIDAALDAMEAANATA
jgi:hypothetical protein